MTGRVETSDCRVILAERTAAVVGSGALEEPAPIMGAVLEVELAVEVAGGALELLLAILAKSVEDEEALPAEAEFRHCELIAFRFNC